jgi:HEAT repeat protein
MTIGERSLNPIADKVIVRAIATTQLLASLGGFLTVPLVFLYGGATARPTAFHFAIFHLSCGLISAIFLYSGLVAARAMALVWHVVLAGGLTYAFFAGSQAGWWLIWLWSVLCLCYLAATSAPAIWAAAKGNPEAARNTILGGSAIILLAVGFHVFSDVSITGLEMQLHSTDGNVRCAAARRLGEKGAAAASALPALKAMLDNTICPHYGEFADDPAADIEKIGGIDPLIEVMRDSKSIGRFAAAWRLRESVTRYPGRATDLKHAFAAGLKNDDDSVRRLSVEGLGDMGQNAADLLPELQGLVDDPSPEVRPAVVEALGKMGSVDSLRQVIASPDQQVRSEAIRALASNGAAAIPALESELNDRSETNAKEAATALSKFGRQALPALSSLEHLASKSADPSTRGAAIEALKNLGPEGLPAIENALGDSDAQVRDYAIALLGSYGRAGVQALALFLDQPWTPSTTRAVDMLGELGPRALPALDALERTAVSSPDQTTRRLAIGALAKIGPPAYSVVVKLANDPDPQTSAEAQSWLKGMRIKYPSLPNP